MSSITLRELLEAGVHFGHRTRRWNPRMKPYIHSRKGEIHIIDLRETLKGLILACKFLQKIAARGEKVLFVGTKRQAKAIVKREAIRCGMYYVNERWLGGTLTNFSTIRKSIQRLEAIEALEKDGTLELESKKRASSLKREKRKLIKNLEGFREMVQLPSALVVVDPRREKTAVAEARKVNIPIVAIIDTDGDPALVDIPIPANDDAVRVIQLLMAKLGDAILNGKAQLPPPPAEEKAAGA